MSGPDQPKTSDATTSTRLEEVDAELVVLARSAGALRLALGDGLARLRTTDGAAELGFPSLGDYAAERLGRRRRWAEDTATTAERLAGLPYIRAAVFRGEVGWSMAEVLARTANEDSELLLLEHARTSTVRAMKALAAQWRAGAELGRGDDGAGAAASAPEPEPGEDESRTLQVTVDRVTAWAFEGTRRFLKAHTGVSDDEALIEALLAEGMDTLRYRHPELRVRSDARDLAERLGEQEAAQALAEQARERDLRDLGSPPEVAEHIAELLSEHLGELPRDPVALDAHLRRVSAELQQRDLRMGQLARDLWEARGWAALGFDSPGEYARERLGCSLASVKARMTLARRCRSLPQVERALDSGRLGFEAARLVARVAVPKTVDGWLTRASARTTKLLTEEVEAVECFARAEGRRAVGPPPDEQVVAEYIALERAMLDGTIADALANGGTALGGGDGPSQMFGEPDGSSQMFGEPDGSSQMFGEPDGSSQMFGEPGEPSQMFGEPDGPSQMFGEPDGSSQMFGEPDGSSQMFGEPDGGGGLAPGAGRVPLRFRLSRELLAWWRDCERTFRASGEPGEWLDFLIRSFWGVWLRRDPERVAYQDVYERERFRCASPVCSNRDLTPHHLRFRSRGGGEERSNLVGLCVACHLSLLHGGRMKAEPPADDIRWTLGRTPFLVVQGRQLLQ